MMGGKAPRQALVQLRQSSGLVEATHGSNGRRSRLVRLAQVVGVVDLRQQRQPLVAERCGVLEASLVERGLNPRPERERAKLRAVERVGDRRRLDEDVLGHTDQLDVG